MELLATADVLVESFRPGVMDKLGLGRVLLEKKFPRLIICSISGYGQDGSDALKVGHDINYLAKSGLLAKMKVPSVLPAQLADIAGGSYPAVMQILAAVYSREKHGKGCYIDISMTHWASILTLMEDTYQLYPNKSGAESPCPLDGVLPCYSIYPTLVFF